MPIESLLTLVARGKSFKAGSKAWMASNASCDWLFNRNLVLRGKPHEFYPVPKVSCKKKTCISGETRSGTMGRPCLASRKYGARLGLAPENWNTLILHSPELSHPTVPFRPYEGGRISLDVPPAAGM